MPIPDFDHNQVLPPHAGDPTVIGHLSPYQCNTVELAERFGFSNERRAILLGFLTFRERVRAAGITTGFQWLDGSFLEDVEAREARSPRDLDVVTVYWGYDRAFQQAVIANFPAFASSAISKADFQIDHFPFDAGEHPQFTLELTRYWIQLFCHNRDAVWKGMLKIDLDTEDSDTQARRVLAPTAA